MMREKNKFIIAILVAVFSLSACGDRAAKEVIVPPPPTCTDDPTMDACDPDRDGLSNADEINTHMTNPNIADTDGDGLEDGEEVNNIDDIDTVLVPNRVSRPLDPCDPNLNTPTCDRDNDGLTNGYELNTSHTDPLVPDTDGDGLKDGEEVNAKDDSTTTQEPQGITDPLNSCDPSRDPLYRDYNHSNTMWQEANCDGDAYLNGTEDNISLLPHETYLSDPYDASDSCFAKKSSNDPCEQGENFFIMCDIVAKDGKTWGDRNIGACRPCETQTDTLCYGDLFQWGRGADGHEKRVNLDTQDLNPTIFPYTGSSLHEIANKGDFDWMNSNSTEEKSAFVAERTASWALETGNPVCPEGWYIPSKSELKALMDSEGIKNGATAFASSLKLGLAGARSAKSSAVESEGLVGYVWSRDSDGVDTGGSGNTAYSFTYDGIATFSRPYKAEGHSVRCIKN